MVWGASSEQGRSPLIVVSCKQDSQKYISELGQSLLLLEQLNLAGVIFQRGNAAVNTARVTKDWFRSHDICFMSWPARCPDLNPIENM